MTSETVKPARGMGGGHAEGYGLTGFASVLLVITGRFNPIYGIAV